jgi:hypothetical protein
MAAPQDQANECSDSKTANSYSTETSSMTAAEEQQGQATAEEIQDATEEPEVIRIKCTYCTNFCELQWSKAVEEMQWDIGYDCDECTGEKKEESTSYQPKLVEIPFRPKTT